MRKLLLYLLKLTYAPYDELPSPLPNETKADYLLRGSSATIHINIASKKRDVLLDATFRSAQEKQVTEVFKNIYLKQA